MLTNGRTPAGPPAPVVSSELSEVEQPTSKKKKRVDLIPAERMPSLVPARGEDFVSPATTKTRTVSLVIPARNEARNLGWVLERIPDGIDEVILVDGSSTDATLAMAQFCRPGIRSVGQDAPGKGAALRAGFAAAKGDIVVMIDADGSMDPQEIPRFIWYLDNGYDFVKGSRFISGGGSLDITPLRRFGNHALMTLVNARFRAQLTDLCYGFCAFHRWWLPSLDLSGSGFEIETEMTLAAFTAGLRMTEVPSVELPRRNGQSALRTFRDGARVLRTIVSTPTRRQVPLGGELSQGEATMTAAPIRKVAGSTGG